MNGADLQALAPILLMGALCIATMLSIAIRRHHGTVAVLAGLSCVATLATLPWAAAVAPRTVTILLQLDGLALLSMGLLLLATLVVIVLSYGYLSLHFAEHEEFEEFYLLLIVAAFGGLVLVAAGHFVSLFLGLELIGVSLYSLIGYLRTKRGPLEASLKYLILSGSASAFLLFGLALLYFQSGSLSFRAVGAAMTGDVAGSPLWVGGFVLVMVGIGFKLGVVPFHLWIPDVYQGAPAPITAFLATVSKSAVVILLLRLTSDLGVLDQSPLQALLSVLAGASMVAGNVLALYQRNVKRMLAYSSIAHFGYLLTALLAGGALAAEAVTFYLIAYVLMTLGAFGVVSLLSTTERDADRLDDYRGLFWSRPWIAAIFMLALLSLAGIPVTAGFVGKFYAIAAGIDAGLWMLVLLLIVNSAVGVYYYLRLIVTLFEREPSTAEVMQIPPTWAITATLGTAGLLLLWLGNYPEPVIDLIRNSILDLSHVAVRP